jgi:hypothetical protein
VSYTVDWITKVVSIPTADLTLVSGNHYSLLMSDCLDEVRRLEWEFAEGLWAPAIIDHSDTRFDFAGANYAPFDDFINGYTVQFTGSATRVDLIGSNNDLVDILVVTGVSVVPSNSAGLQRVVVGGGLDPTQDTKLSDLHVAHFNRRYWNKVNNTITLYDTDGLTPLFVFDTNADLSDIEPQ